MQKRNVIVIVEDSPDLTLTLERQLQHYGYETLAFTEGKDALAWLEHNLPSLVLLDVMLPGMSGYEICRQLRLKHTAAVLPVIMLSALGGQAEERVKGLQAGANDFVAKPYHFSELQARIDGLLSVKQEYDESQDLLSTYIARTLHEQVQQEPGLLKRRAYQVAIVMFADIRGFTRLAETADAKTPLRVLDEFYQTMMPAIKKYNGLVLDLTGDEMLITFNVPYEIPNANYMSIQAAAEMQQLFRQLQAQWKREGFDVGLGIGIHQGQVTMGNIGSPELMRYTVMGKVVNLAHRLVELAKDDEIIISAEVYNKTHRWPPWFDIDFAEVRVRGIDQPQLVYRIQTVAPIQNDEGFGDEWAAPTNQTS